MKAGHHVTVALSELPQFPLPSKKRKCPLRVKRIGEGEPVLLRLSYAAAAV